MSQGVFALFMSIRQRALTSPCSQNAELARPQFHVRHQSHHKARRIHQMASAKDGTANQRSLARVKTLRNRSQLLRNAPGCPHCSQARAVAIMLVSSLRRLAVSQQRKNWMWILSPVNLNEDCQLTALQVGSPLNLVSRFGCLKICIAIHHDAIRPSSSSWIPLTQSQKLVRREEFQVWCGYRSKHLALKRQLNSHHLKCEISRM